MLKKLVPGLESAICKTSKAKAEILLTPGSRLEFGSRWIKALPTPGHTSGCMSYVLDDGSMVFTGDALLIRGCGRTDFQEGSSETLYDSIHSQLFCLPYGTIVFPAHDYKVSGCILMKWLFSMQQKMRQRFFFGPIPSHIYFLSSSPSNHNVGPNKINHWGGDPLQSSSDEI